MAFRWQADDGPALNAGLVALWFLRGSGPVLLRNPLFVIFQGGPDPLSPLWIRAYKATQGTMRRGNRTQTNRDTNLNGRKAMML